MQNLLKKMREIGYNDYMIELVKERVLQLRRLGVKNTERFVRKLTDRLNNKEEYLDIVMEGRFAIILARNGFSDINIEYTKKGPDIKATWNKQTIYFEVTRKRAREDEWADQSEAHFICPISIENIVSKIKDKTPQLLPGQINVVVLWGDTIQLGSHEFEEVLDSIKQSVPEEYKNLSGILFTEGGGVNLTTYKQFRFFKNDNALKPIGIRLAKKLDSLYECNIEKLKKEWDEISAAIARSR